MSVTIQYHLWYKSCMATLNYLAGIMTVSLYLFCLIVHKDYPSTAVGQKAVSVSGAKLWNTIPMNIRNLNTVPTFIRSKVLCTNTSSSSNNHMGTNPNLFNKTFGLRQFLHNVKEFDLFEKYVN